MTVPENGVLVVRNFVSPPEVALLVSILDAADEPTELKSGEDRQILFKRGARRTEIEVSEKMSALLEPAVVKQVLAIRDRVAAAICEVFEVQGHSNDFSALVEMREGDSHRLHADAERLTPKGWQPNHCPWRSLSALLYLNTQGVDFEGGQLSLPGVGLTLSPEVGMLVAFTAGRRHQHEVWTITAGKRRTMPVWLRDDHWVPGAPTE
jgi:predicted 2-oxoglutarate/Fe(II)-dependent dioxygenase YbiX